MKLLLAATLISLTAFAQTRDTPPPDPRAPPAPVLLPTSFCTITINYLQRDPSKATAHVTGNFCDDADVDLALSVALANRLGLTAYR